MPTFNQLVKAGMLYSCCSLSGSHRTPTARVFCESDAAFRFLIQDWMAVGQPCFSRQLRHERFRFPV